MRSGPKGIMPRWNETAEMVQIETGSRVSRIGSQDQDDLVGTGKPSRLAMLPVY